MLQNEMLGQFNGDCPLDAMARYHLGTGGKYLRGQLALAEAQAMGVAQAQALPWALACEMLHNATLVHDDIQDNDPIRRGQTSLWKKFGLAQAINVGDYFIFRAFGTTANLANPRLSLFMAETAQELVTGQCQELSPDIQSIEQISPHYETLAKRKTGTLFQLPVIGAQLLKDSAINLQLQESWFRLGLSYQIYDDIKDYLGLKQTGQKQKDFVEGRLNALVAKLALRSENKSLIETYLQESLKKDVSQKTISQLNNAIEKQNVIGELKSQLLDHLDDFKLQASAQSQQVILKYMSSIMEIRTQYEPQIQI